MDGRKVYKLQVFRDAGGKWRWHLRSANGRIMATSGESFASRNNAWRAAAGMQDLLHVSCTLTTVTPDTKHGAAGRKAANAKAGRTGRTTRKAAQQRVAARLGGA
jgi:uncharacterized protein YegP (UPF0339 family)